MGGLAKGYRLIWSGSFVLVQKQPRIFVAVLCLISIPKCEVIYEQVLGGAYRYVHGIIISKSTRFI
jgi:hypothetical protein